MTGVSPEADPLADEAFMSVVVRATQAGLQDVELQKMLTAGSFTPETLAWFAVIHEAREAEKPLSYTRKSREISKRVIELLEAGHGEA